MSKRTITEKLIGLKDAWADTHIGDIAGEALDKIAELQARLDAIGTAARWAMEYRADGNVNAREVLSIVENSDD